MYVGVEGVTNNIKNPIYNGLFLKPKSCLLYSVALPHFALRPSQMTKTLNPL